jgi:uncharacterized repeat protein (TIGR03803 family)
MDSSGALYGSAGPVFQLAPPVGGGTPWSLVEIFAGGGNDGFIFDKSGALYGAASFGGESSNCPYGCGTVFKLTPPTGGGTQWNETVLYGFQGGSDGSSPNGGLIMDSTGALYGTTAAGGTSNNGTVFKLTPPPGGGTPWIHTVLYSFQGGSDGSGPNGWLIRDWKGALYGTTSGGGTYGYGTVFRLQGMTKSPIL